MDPTKKVRKIVTLDLDVWAEIEDWMFQNRVKVDSEALRQFIEAGAAQLLKTRRKRK